MFLFFVIFVLPVKFLCFCKGSLAVYTSLKKKTVYLKCIAACGLDFCFSQIVVENGGGEVGRGISVITVTVNSTDTHETYFL